MSCKQWRIVVRLFQYDLFCLSAIHGNKHSNGAYCLVLDSFQHQSANKRTFRHYAVLCFNVFISSWNIGAFRFIYSRSIVKYRQHESICCKDKFSSSDSAFMSYGRLVDNGKTWIYELMVIHSFIFIYNKFGILFLSQRTRLKNANSN